MSVPLNLQPPAAFKPARPAVQLALKEVGTAPGCLIPLLEHIQDRQGNLEPEDLAELSKVLQIPLAEVYGVATFYAHFKLSKATRHIVSLCTGTACHVKGAGLVLTALQKRLGIKPGESTPDGRFHLDTSRCFGACALAPVLRVGQDTYAKVTPEMIPGILEKYP